MCVMSRMRPLDSIHCDLYVINFLKLADKSMTSVMEGKEGALLVGPTEYRSDNSHNGDTDFKPAGSLDTGQ